MQHVFHCCLISIRSQSHNYSNGNVTEVTLVPELLALVNVADMTLNERNINTSDSVSDCDRCVGVSSRVDDDKVNLLCPCTMDTVDQEAFVVRLECGESDSFGGA